MKNAASADLPRIWPERIRDVIENAGVAMFTTVCDDGLRARPLEPRLDRETGTLWFLTDARSDKEWEIAAEHDVGLSFIDIKAKAYLSITARAFSEINSDTARQIWRETDSVWWPGGPTDPNLRVLKIEPLRAELWDGPASQIAQLFEFAKAKLTGEPPNLGENRKVTLDLRPGHEK